MAISIKDKDIKNYHKDYIEDEIAIPKKRISSLGTMLTFIRRGT